MFDMLVFQEFGDHENVVKLLNVIKADNDKDIYLVFEYMGKLFILYKATYSLILNWKYISFCSVTFWINYIIQF